jgi:Zn-dependent protease with chaperone function
MIERMRFSLAILLASALAMAMGIFVVPEINFYNFESPNPGLLMYVAATVGLAVNVLPGFLVGLLSRLHPFSCGLIVGLFGFLCQFIVNSDGLGLILRRQMSTLMAVGAVDELTSAMLAAGVSALAGAYIRGRLSPNNPLDRSGPQ